MLPSGPRRWGGVRGGGGWVGGGGGGRGGLGLHLGQPRSGNVVTDTGAVVPVEHLNDGNLAAVDAVVHRPPVYPEHRCDLCGAERGAGNAVDRHEVHGGGGLGHRPTDRGQALLASSAHAAPCPVRFLSRDGTAGLVASSLRGSHFTA